MKRLYTASHLPEAHLVRGLLHAVGIPARVLNEFSQSGFGELPAASAYPEVWVDDDRDLTRAREIVAAYEQERFAAGSLTCPHCGEQNPQHFAVCWHCQKAL